MTELDNLPDDFWRKAFNEADETPPPRVWDAIEHRLDESRSSGIIPLWASGAVGSRPLVWGTGLAAAVALVLIGWWVFSNQPAPRTLAHVDSAIYQPAPTKTKDVTSLPGQLPGEKVAGTRKQHSRSTQSLPVGSERSAIAQAEPTRVESRVTSEPASVRAPSVRSRLSAVPDVLLSFNAAASLSRPVGPEARLAANAAMTSGQESASLATPAFERIAAPAIRLRGPGAIHRIVWVRPADTDDITEEASERVRSKQNVKPVWASLTVMPNAFNPSVSVRSTPMVVISSLATGNVNPDRTALSNRAELSMAYQAGAGVQLNDRWSIESGVGYLIGRSTVGSPGQSGAYYSAQVVMINSAVSGSNLYVDALRNSLQARTTNAGQKTSADALAANNAYVNQAAYDAQGQQLVTNNYQFVQVPVQVGYQLRPRKRLGLALLGGFLTNIFVRNTVSDALVINPGDGVYRPVALAANVGARLRFRPSPRWSASLAGLYQPTLGSATQSAAPVQSHPTSAGMSFGVDYHF